MLRSPLVGRRRGARLPILLPFVAVATSASAGPVWDLDLVDDARDSAITAQRIDAGPLTRIVGRLSATGLTGGPDLVDMYMLEIDRPSLLEFSTAGGAGGASFDTQLFLFRSFGNPANPFARALLGNDDAAPGNSGSRLGQTANDGSDFILLTPGTYFLAISGAGTDPIGADGLLWTGLAPGVVGYGNERTLTGWQGTGATGDYTILVSGATGVPAPATALVALAGFVGRSRRRAR